MEDREIFTSIAEEASRPPTEVINLGVSGYGTDQEYLLWRSLGRQFRPDEVILAVVPYTDIWENTSDTAYGYPKPVIRFATDGTWQVLNQPVPQVGDKVWRPGRTQYRPVADELKKRHPLARLAAHSALVSSTIVALGRWDGPRRWLEYFRISPVRDHQMSWEPLTQMEPPLAEAVAGWDSFLKLIGLIHADARKSGAGFRVLIVPTVIQVYPELWERFVTMNPLPPGARWDPRAPNRRITTYCREKGIPVIDPLPALSNAARTNPFLYFPWNSHWTPAAHHLVAEELLREMALSNQGRH